MNNHHGHDRIHLNPDERAIVGIPEEIEVRVSDAAVLIDLAREARGRDPREVAAATGIIDKVSDQALRTQVLGMVLKQVKED